VSGTLRTLHAFGPSPRRAPGRIVRCIATARRVAWPSLAALAGAVPAWAQEGGAAGAGGATHPGLLNVNPGLMIWTIVTFVLLLVVLRVMAWGPLQKSLDAREKRIRDAVEGAEKARRDSEELLARHQKMLDAAKDEARQIIEEGKQDGLKLRQEILDQARNDAEEHNARARREIDLATDAAKKELWDHATRLSTEIAERILRRALDRNDDRRLVENVVEEFSAQASRGAR